MTKTVEVCVCGHPVSRHSHVGTDYSACKVWTGGKTCRCFGEVRAAVWVNETVESPNATESSARFFKRQFYIDKPEVHALSGGVLKARSEGLEVVWAVDECDRCGGERNGDLIARYVSSTGKILRSGMVDDVPTRSILICTFCEMEDSVIQEGSEVQLAEQVHVPEVELNEDGEWLGARES